MKALVYNGTTAEVMNVTQPVAGIGESLIRVTLAAVCSTDREILRGYKPDFTGIMGHEFVGVVEQSDDMSLVGKRVVGELNAGCGECIYCKSGRENHCLSRRVIGITGKDGCFAEFLTQRNDLLHIVPDALPDEVAIFCEPLAAALRIAELVHVKPSTTVCVLGDGRLGFMIAQALSLTGAEMSVCGRSEQKLAAFAPFADAFIDTDRTFELVVDATGSPSGIAAAKRLVRKGGTVALKSTYAGDASINLSAFVVDEVSIVTSRCGPFAPALRLLERGLVRLPDIKLYELDDWRSAFDSDSFKAGFRISE